MIFPFEITRKYKLPDSEFRDYKSTEIIDRIYDFLKTENFKQLNRKGNTIEIVGDFKKAFIYNTDPFTQCVDKGFITIEEKEDKRTIIYKYQSLHCIVFMLLTVALPIFVILSLIETINCALKISGIIVCFILGVWILYQIVHSTTISAPIEIMRTESIRKNINGKNYGC